MAGFPAFTTITRRDKMKITIGKRERNIFIPSEILKLAGLNSTDELELHISDGVVFMAKK